MTTDLVARPVPSAESGLMQQIIEFFGDLGGAMWGPWTFFMLMGAGILFTVWSKCTQFTALTHGVQVVRGIYDDPDDPGALNHFQALSAALSATIGLGNIGGVALAIGAGGPGALFWMWIIGFLGMALKTIEITLAMIYRNTEDPDNPHGGAMWVVDKVVGGRGGIWRPIARAIGVFFCVTLVVSTFTGGNMFQAWSVADITRTFWNVPPIVTGIVIAILVGLVIVGGIKRIGSVAGWLVPVMCVLYLISGLAVVAMHVTEVPGVLALVVRSAFQPTEAGGAFLGGTAAWAFSTGLRRALFSNEAGQGSAPIAHAAARTNEPAREGIVGGMGPFIDTICICTLTALVILLTNTWNREPLVEFEGGALVAPVFALDASPLHGAPADAIGARVYVAVDPPQGANPDAPAPPDRIQGEVVRVGDGMAVAWEPYTAFAPPSHGDLQVMRVGAGGEPGPAVGVITALPATRRALGPGDAPYWGLLTADQRVDIAPEDAFLWDGLDTVFTVLEGDVDIDTRSTRHTLKGMATLQDGDTVVTTWETMTSVHEPTLVQGTGMFRDYGGASLTAHAFDRQFPGFGKVLVAVAAWLFALSTMISWSYYGEQGMIYMLGSRSVLPYKLVFLVLTVLAAVMIEDAGDMEALMDLGTGAMLWSNMPIVVLLGFLGVRSLNDYKRRLKAGAFVKHRPPR